MTGAELDAGRARRDRRTADLRERVKAAIQPKDAKEVPAAKGGRKECEGADSLDSPFSNAARASSSCYLPFVTVAPDS